MYANGRGVPKDDAEAVRWWRLAAAQGDAMAQYHLGLMYAKGEGIPADYVTAYAWVNVAAARGHKDAAELRDTLTSLMTAEQIAEAQRLSATFYASSAVKE